MYLCICKALTDKQINEAVGQGARTFGDLSARFGIGAECGKCVDSIREFLDVCLAAPPPATANEVPAPNTTDVVLAPTTADAAPARAAWFAIDL
jgi:bacterioferritin-associated ferredoxin